MPAHDIIDDRNEKLQNERAMTSSNVYVRALLAILMAPVHLAVVPVLWLQKTYLDLRIIWLKYQNRRKDRQLERMIADWPREEQERFRAELQAELRAARESLLREWKEKGKPVPKDWG